jgi:hypothetical protein
VKSAFSKYSQLALALIPILLFNIGVQTFHDCNNLQHHHNELSFETGHDECLICEAKLHPFEDIQFIQMCEVEVAYTLSHNTSVPPILKQDLELASNKGPPAQA